MQASNVSQAYLCRRRLVCPPPFSGTVAASNRLLLHWSHQRCLMDIVNINYCTAACRSSYRINLPLLVGLLALFMPKLIGASQRRNSDLKAAVSKDSDTRSILVDEGRPFFKMYCSTTEVMGGTEGEYIYIGQWIEEGSLSPVEPEEWLPSSRPVMHPCRSRGKSYQRTEAVIRHRKRAALWSACRYRG